MMRLTKQDIENIDSWLKNRGFKYIDIRFELLDHLVSEYEEVDNYPDLESFLKERLEWCKEVEKKKKKTINFSTTRELFKNFIKSFTNIKFLFALVLSTLILMYVESIVTSEIYRKILYSIYTLIIIYQLYLMIFSGFGSKLKKEAISVVYLLNIFTISQLPLHFIGIFPDVLFEKKMLYIPYLSFGIVLSLNAILFFYEKRKSLLENFEILKKQNA